jgi:polyhydroxybutyrate depolymerase
MLTSGRHWQAHVPPHHHGPMPAVLLLHGAGGSSRSVMRQTGIARHADARGVLVISADGTSPRPDAHPQFLTNPQMWNDGSGLRAGPAFGVDDVGHLSAVLDEAYGRFRVDPSRVYAMGFSNGGSMALRLAAEMPERIAAAAADAGQPFVEPRAGARPVPTVCVCGTADPLVPLVGGRVQLPWGVSLHQPSYLDSVASWARAAGCEDDPDADAPADGVGRMRWAGADGAEVELHLVEGAGHVWPGGTSTMPELLVGTDPRTFDATGAMLDFLLERSL